MKFAYKIFFSIFFSSGIIAGSISLLFYYLFSYQTERNFKIRYESTSETLGHTLEQLEEKTDILMKSTLFALEELIKRSGVPSNAQLTQFAKKLNVNQLYVTDHQGRFIRSTRDLAKQLPNIFSFCKIYETWLKNGTEFKPTGILLAVPSGEPFKFLILPILNKKYLLEVGILADFIGSTLNNVIKSDPNVLSIGLTSANGTPLGTFRGDLSATRPSPSNLIVKRKVRANFEECCSCERRGLTQDGKYFYFIQVEVSRATLLANLKQIIHISFFIFFVALLFGFLFSIWLTKLLVTKIEYINSTVGSIIRNGNLETRIGIQGRDEIAGLAQKFDQMLEALQGQQLENLKLERKNAKIQIAEQVAHDIRSPLAALEMILGSLAQLQEEKRLIIRSAVARIKDIANSLIESHRNKRENNLPLVCSLIDTVVTEKRTQYRSKLGIEIESRINSASYGLFALVDSTEFKRVISNLINNSVEAIEVSGKIVIQIWSGKTDENDLNSKDNIKIEISDTGKGIPASVIEKLGTRGITYGKSGGSGLGLFHAKTRIKCWGGTLTLTSRKGVGTTLLISLPRTEAPTWFVPSLCIACGSTLVILDDDNTIHQIWQQRFEAITTPESKVNIRHFSSATHLIEWFNMCPTERPSTFYLVDYELIGNRLNGLSLIEYLNIQKKSYLVTSHYEELEVQEKSTRLGVKIIPKGMAGFVPISLRSQKIPQSQGPSQFSSLSTF